MFDIGLRAGVRSEDIKTFNQEINLKSQQTQQDTGIY